MTDERSDPTNYTIGNRYTPILMNFIQNRLNFTRYSHFIYDLKFIKYTDFYI